MIVEFCVVICLAFMAHICITLFNYLIFVVPLVNGVYYKNGTARVSYPIIHISISYINKLKPYGAILVYATNIKNVLTSVRIIEYDSFIIAQP